MVRTARRTRQDESGFTLIEVLIVTAIVAILSLAAVLSLRPAPGASPAARVGALARAVRFLQDEALYTRQSFALAFWQGGWRALEFDADRREWLVRPADRPHAIGQWEPDLRVALTIEERPVLVREALPEPVEPDAMLLASGETTPFRIALSGDGSTASCTMDAYGGWRCRRGQ